MVTVKKSAAADAVESLGFQSEAVRQGYERFTKSLGTLADFQKHTLEALIASAGAAARGVETATSEHATYAKECYEDCVAAARATSSCASIQEAFDVQGDYLRAAFEKNLNQFNRLADHWVTTTKAVAEPMTSRYGAFVEMVQSYRP
jgi:hypothetical protein